jgi:hypothetical protein
MNKKKLTGLSLVLTVLGLTATSVVPSVAQTEPPPIAVEPLTPRSEFTDDVDLKIR